jgi:hypothetical protein
MTSSSVEQSIILQINITTLICPINSLGETLQRLQIASKNTLLLVHAKWVVASSFPKNAPRKGRVFFEEGKRNYLWLVLSVGWKHSTCSFHCSDHVGRSNNMRLPTWQFSGKRLTVNH